MNWLYVLHNDDAPPFIDTGFPYLISIGSYFHYGNLTFEVMEYLPLDEFGQETFDDAEFCVICNQVHIPFDYTTLKREIKLNSLGIKDTTDN